MKIAVAGTGYVGLSNAVLLAQHNCVIAYDIDKDRVKKINNKISTVVDKEITQYFNEKELNIGATDDYENAFKEVPPGSGPSADCLLFPPWPDLRSPRCRPMPGAPPPEAHPSPLRSSA